MNTEIIKKEIVKHVGNNIRLTIYGMRNHTDYYEGIIYKVYPNFFTIIYNGQEKSFNYRDIITGDIKIKYL